MMWDCVFSFMHKWEYASMDGFTTKNIYRHCKNCDTVEKFYYHPIVHRIPSWRRIRLSDLFLSEALGSKEYAFLVEQGWINND